jgi:hypothetical protein
MRSKPLDVPCTFPWYIHREKTLCGVCGVGLNLELLLPWPANSSGAERSDNLPRRGSLHVIEYCVSIMLQRDKTGDDIGLYEITCSTALYQFMISSPESPD